MTPYEHARALFRKFHTRDPFELAENLGISVYRKNLGSLQGLYFFADNRAYIIINECICTEKQRMVCAHELGHDQLHRDLTGSVFSELLLFDRSGKPEIEANTFAAELLLDDADVLSTAENGASDLYSLASILNVYPEFLLFKLHSMNRRGFRISLPGECGTSFWQKHLS